MLYKMRYQPSTGVCLSVQSVRLCSVIHVRTQPGVLRYARFVDVGGGRGGAYAGRN